PIRRSRSSHLSFGFEPNSGQLLILSPNIIERRAPTPQELEYLRTLDAALEGFRELRAGGAGLITLIPIADGDNGEHTLLGRSHVWKTTTSYVVTRHMKSGLAKDALVADVIAECRRFGLP